MIKGFSVVVTLFLLGSGAWAQIEKGDSESSSIGHYITRVGEDVEVDGSDDSYVYPLGDGGYTQTTETVSA
ncbi:MAG: hypothetical protein ACFFDN_49470, partial [Candidatus Hodarchaeota archaeon]